MKQRQEVFFIESIEELKELIKRIPKKSIIVFNEVKK
jgi:hypothetical protein